MLVHGYCSDGNPFPTSQFTGEIVFNDPNQNRTHDQFANLIRNFGASYPSFGIVAHSQGGAASLHLYTYYWSGLDYATGGSRLIQSVGTPYQGTALAGNLACLDNIFGAGCGYNYESDLKRCDFVAFGNSFVGKSKSQLLHDIIYRQMVAL